MVPINNSDTAWLIVSDFLQDNGIGFPDELRKEILDPGEDQWHVLYMCNLMDRVGSGIGSRHVGVNSYIHVSMVGIGDDIGGVDVNNGPINIGRESASVGGNSHYPY